MEIIAVLSLYILVALLIAAAIKYQDDNFNPYK
jgi:hypothetical protein